MDPAQAPGVPETQENDEVETKQKSLWKRIMMAFILTGGLVLAALGSDAAGHEASSSQLWGLATSALGVLVILLGGYART